MPTDLATVTTDKLIAELSRREGVRKLTAGAYQAYKLELKPKYTKNRKPEELEGEVLVVTAS